MIQTLKGPFIKFTIAIVCILAAGGLLDRKSVV